MNRAADNKSAQKSHRFFHQKAAWNLNYSAGVPMSVGTDYTFDNFEGRDEVILQVGLHSCA